MRLLVSQVKWWRISKGWSAPLKVIDVQTSRESQHLQGWPRPALRLGSSLHGLTLPTEVDCVESKRGRNNIDFMFRGCLRAAIIFLLSMTFLILSLGSITSAAFRTESSTFGLALLWVKMKGRLTFESVTESWFCSRVVRFRSVARFIPELITPSGYCFLLRNVRSSFRREFLTSTSDMIVHIRLARQ